MDLLRASKTLAWAAFASACVANIQGCATTVPYVWNDSGFDVYPMTSRYHLIEYLRVYENADRETVLYGKVKHLHERLDSEPPVHVTIETSSGKEIMEECIPLRFGVGNKQRGWNGAAFRTKINTTPQRGTKIIVAIHDQSITDLTALPAEACDCSPRSVGVCDGIQTCP